MHEVRIGCAFLTTDRNKFLMKNPQKSYPSDALWMGNAFQKYSAVGLLISLEDCLQDGYAICNCS